MARRILRQTKLTKTDHDSSSSRVFLHTYKSCQALRYESVDQGNFALENVRGKVHSLDSEQAFHSVQSKTHAVFSESLSPFKARGPVGLG